ncbi:hypothetical protein H2200_013462 [Cladophialophora chaetospira]|uniref:Uncharacterized protein n=1 Tax=Cladophialophora chaetospira TaxID=386627 RepID=A0AA38UE00_9EURO|nr:hypothetical protein H2200_013462 [Cladophialophora chaetospira]
MARKRRNTSSPEPDDDSPPPKRRTAIEFELNYDSEDEDEKHETPYVDERSGQSGAFPGLAGHDNELFYGPANDGIDYLRMVRSEAKSVPLILTAPVAGVQKTELEEGEEVEDGGYFSDGAYTALNHTNVADLPSLPPAQIRYYDSLVTQFRLVQATLRCSPPLSAVETLRPDQFVSFPENNQSVRAQWEHHMLSADPHPVQLACMDAYTIVGLVQFLGMKLEKMLQTKDVIEVARVGAWIWAVLGRCRDRGELASEEIGDLRDLAQLALRLQQRNSEENAKTKVENGLKAKVAPQDDTRGVDSPGTISNHSAGVPATTGELDNDAKHQKLLSTTFDTIVTIVGEIYGQRDLLELRTKWVEDEVK